MKPENIYNYKGFKINVYQDENSDCDQDWLNTDEAFLIYDHRQFSVKVKGYNGQEINDHCGETKKLFYEGFHVFPCYAYIHSGVSLSLSRSGYPFTCPWDTSMAGFVMIKQIKGWSWTRKKAEAIANSVVKNWNDALSGNVWGYTITYNSIEVIDGSDYDPDNDEEIDSCWGFYGNNWKEDSYMVEECKAIIDHVITKNPEKYAIKQLQLDL